jgi:hypothetical protein
MEWCLECHRAPERFVRPVNRFSTWTGDRKTNDEELAEGVDLKAKYQIQGKRF